MSLKREVSDAGIQVALRIAMAKFNGQPLTVNGTNEFKERCIEAAVRADLPVVFADVKMEKARLERLCPVSTRQGKTKENRHGNQMMRHPREAELARPENESKRGMSR